MITKSIRKNSLSIPVAPLFLVLASCQSYTIERKRQEAFLQGLHEHLGSESPIRQLPQLLAQDILKLVGNIKVRIASSCTTEKISIHDISKDGPLLGTSVWQGTFESERFVNYQKIIIPAHTPLRISIPKEGSVYLNHDETNGLKQLTIYHTYFDKRPFTATILKLLYKTGDVLEKTFETCIIKQQQEALLQGLYPLIGKTSPVSLLTPELVKNILQLAFTNIELLNATAISLPLQIKISDITKNNDSKAPVVWHGKIEIGEYAAEKIKIPVNTQLRISLYHDKIYLGTTYLYPEENTFNLNKMSIHQVVSCPNDPHLGSGALKLHLTYKSGYAIEKEFEKCKRL